MTLSAVSQHISECLELLGQAEKNCTKPLLDQITSLFTKIFALMQNTTAFDTMDMYNLQVCTNKFAKISEIFYQSVPQIN